MADKVDLTKRQWDPDDPELSSDMCAWEASAIQRMVWNRWSGTAVAEFFGITEHDIRVHFAEQHKSVQQAWMRNRPIYAARFNPGYDSGEKLG